ncbi:MAG: amidase domain-containing protein, partial [Anaerolineae bacterium]
MASLLATVLAVAWVSQGSAQGNYNRAAAKNYADGHCRNYNPEYDCGFGADCQNFASQVLNAGGIPEWGWFRWDSKHWFFTNCTWYANSWTVNPWFDSHTAKWPDRYQNVGWDNIQDADPVLFKFDWCDDWCHTGMYMGWGWIQEGGHEGEWGELRSQHTPERCRVWF